MINMLSSSIFSFPKDESRENQDAVLCPKKLPNGYLMAVADGVGGYKGGKEASSEVISYLSQLNDDIKDVDLDDIFFNMKRNVTSLSSKDGSLYSAATTITFCYVNNDHVIIGHSGDCRLYFKQDKKLKQITKDHTQHQILIDKGMYTARQLKNAPGGNVITTAISAKIVLEYQVICIPKNELPLESGKLTLFIMSDGAHHFWEKRPRFSPNTLASPSRFSSSLQKRIENLGATDDYSLLSACIHFES
ncbi:serine/threonine-protein phosphatase [Yersinia enterocolitica]|nr:serine/threonine-protein phosphatase [Yersinia enterocolitica]